MCVSARQSVAFVSEVSLYCPHVMEYIVHNRGVVRETSNQNNDNAISDLKAVIYLDLLLSCVTNIGKLVSSIKSVKIKKCFFPISSQNLTLVLYILF